MGTQIESPQNGPERKHFQSVPKQICDNSKLGKIAPIVVPGICRAAPDCRTWNRHEQKHGQRARESKPFQPNKTKQVKTGPQRSNIQSIKHHWRWNEKQPIDFPKRNLASVGASKKSSVMQPPDGCLRGITQLFFTQSSSRLISACPGVSLAGKCRIAIPRASHAAASTAAGPVTTMRVSLCN
jgi:hypothetical protein